MCCYLVLMDCHEFSRNSSNVVLDAFFLLFLKLQNQERNKSRIRDLFLMKGSHLPPNFGRPG